MKRLELTPALRTAAERCVWYEPPERAVADTARFAAHVMTYGAVSDVTALREQLTTDDLRAVLDAAPPGIFDPRSWSYWNLMVGRREAPPLPERVLP